MRRVLAGAIALLVALVLVESWLVELLDSTLPKAARNAMTLAVLGLSIAIVTKHRRWREFTAHADIALAVFGLVLLASAAFGGVEATVTAQAAYVYLRGVVVFYAIRILQPRTITLVYLGTAWALANAAIAIVQIGVGEPAYTVLGWSDLTAAAIHRAQGLHEHPNELGHLLGLGILFWCARRRWWIVALLGLGLAATQSRESLLGVACGLAVMAVRQRRFLYPMLALILVATIPVIVLPGARAEVAKRAWGVVDGLGIPIEHPRPGVDPNLPVCDTRVAAAGETSRGGVMSSPCRSPHPAREIRIVYARQGWQLLVARPLLGYGPGTFGGIVALETNPSWNLHPRFGPAGFDMHGFHGKTVDSFWLHLLVELGAVGLVALLVWLWLVSRPARPVMAFGVVVSVFSPALESPMLPVLLFGLIGYSGVLTGYPSRMKTTWKAPERERHGQLTSRADLPDEIFAFPDKRKEPLTDAEHVRNALARFDQVEDVTDTERDLAFANIVKAAKHYDVDIKETNWRQLGKPK